MAVMPRYTKTEIGAFPEDWPTESLGALFEFSNGVNADKRAYGHGHRFVNVLEPITHSHLYGPEISGRVSLPDSVVTAYAVKTGDVLFNRTSETDTDLGLAATYLGTERIVFGGFVIRGRPTDARLNPTYAGYALRAPAVRSQIVRMGQGAIRSNIGQQNLRLVIAPIPPKAEQDAIAAALSDVDALVGGLERLIAKKRDTRQAVMQQLLTGLTRLRGFNGEWDVASLEMLTTRDTGVWGKNDPDERNSHRAEIIRAGDISQDGRLTSTASRYVAPEEFEKAKCGLDDLVITTSGNGLGKLWWCDGRSNIAASNFVRVLRPNANRVVGRFLAFALRSGEGLRQLQEHTATSAYPNLRPTYFSTQWIPLPDVSEQAAIADALSDMDAEIEALEARRDKTRALKHGMMQELLTGRTRLV